MTTNIFCDKPYNKLKRTPVKLTLVNLTYVKITFLSSAT